MKSSTLSACILAIVVFWAAQSRAACPAVGGCGVGTGIYWADEVNGTIGSANLDGSAPTDVLIVGAIPTAPGGEVIALGVFGVGLSLTKIYWANVDDTIGSANLDGSGVNNSLVTTGFSQVSPIVSGGFIYWSFPADAIGRANLNGTGVEVLTPGPGQLINVGDIVTDGTYIYWVNRFADAIGRVNIDGDPSTINPSFISLPTQPSYLALNPTLTKIYWTNSDTNSIGVATIAGTVLNNSLIPSLGAQGNYPGGISVDSSFIYWAENTPTIKPNGGLAGTSVIGRANLDGTNPNYDFITPPPIPCTATACSGPTPAGLIDGIVVVGSGSPGACGLGWEAALILPLLMWLRSWRRGATAKMNS